MDKRQLILSSQERDMLRARLRDKITIGVGYVMGWDTPTYRLYMALMRRIDPTWPEEKNCSDCNFRMAKRVWEQFDAQVFPENYRTVLDDEQVEKDETTVVYPPKNSETETEPTPQTNSKPARNGSKK